MPITNTEMNITAKDGGTFKAFAAYPESTHISAPIVILIQEIFGINNEMREKCNYMAQQGYIALCPDLFWRIEPNIDLTDSIPEQLERAFELFGLFDVDQGLEDLSATLNVVRDIKEIRHESRKIPLKTNNKVGCIGYCLGGMLAYRMATDTDIDATISYYGVGIDAMLDKKDNIHKPLMLHIAGQDEFVPQAAQEKIISELQDVHKDVHIYHYEGMNHAFARGKGLHYNAEAANLANKRTMDFLESALQ